MDADMTFDKLLEMLDAKEKLKKAEKPLSLPPHLQAVKDRLNNKEYVDMAINKVAERFAVAFTQGLEIGGEMDNE
jgi:hypothetical protein